MSHPAQMNKTKLTLAISVAIAGLSMGQPAWSSCTVDGQTFTVNVTTDIGGVVNELTLREAVVLANANPNCDNIVFDAALNLDTITLTQSAVVIATENVNVIGPGSGSLTITNVGTSNRALNLNASDVGISGLTFDGSLGGFPANSRLHIYGYDGMGRTVTATVDDIVVKNTGGMRIAQALTATVTNSTFSGNSETGLDIGGSSADVTIDNTTLSGNATNFGGGGLDISGAMTTLISNTTVDNNTSTTNAGGIYISPLADSTTTIIDSTISNNSSTGAINESALSTSSGGGILTDNTKNVYTLNIVQTTISGNTTAATGGGLFIGDRGAAASINILHSTISNNTATYGGGLWSTAGADINLSNTVIAQNTSTSGMGNHDVGFDSVSTLAGDVSADYSFLGVNNTNVTDSGAGGTSFNGGDAMLLALAAGGVNGTQVHTPDASSPLIDMGDPLLTQGTGTTPATDQVGNERIATARIDIGSVEFVPVVTVRRSSGGLLGVDAYLLGMLATILGFVRYRRKK